MSLAKVLYSACAGAAATVIGAAASLAAPAADRAVVWCVVAGVASIGAGLLFAIQRAARDTPRSLQDRHGRG
jgi:energy-converting hydrogenase Eha subunit E